MPNFEKEPTKIEYEPVSHELSGTEKSNNEQKNPSKIMEQLQKIRDLFRNAIMTNQPDTSKLLTTKMKEELASAEREATRDGVNFAKCQMDKIIEANNKGKQVEFETLSPYLADYNTATGEIWSDNLTKSDAIGLALSRTLRDNFPKARMISLYDEYNSNIPDSSTLLGNPMQFETPDSTVQRYELDKKGRLKPTGVLKDARQLSFPEKTKGNFKNNLEKLFRSAGSIRKDDQEGKNYLFVSESSKVESAEQLVRKLEDKGKIKRDGQAIYFVNPEAENPAYREITLRTSNGRWLCEALDASSYLDEKNLEITHLVVLPNQFIEQQDKVWGILRTLGIEPTNYHNIFYDENIPPEQVTRVIQEEIDYFLKNKAEVRK